MSDAHDKLKKDTIDLVRFYNQEPDFKSRFDQLVENRNATFRNRPLRLYVITIARFSPRYKEYETKTKSDPATIPELFTTFYRNQADFLYFQNQSDITKLFSEQEHHALSQAEAVSDVLEQYKKYQNFFQEKDKESNAAKKDQTPQPIKEETKEEVKTENAEPAPSENKPVEIAPEDTEKPPKGSLIQPLSSPPSSLPPTHSPSPLTPSAPSAPEAPVTVENPIAQPDVVITEDHPQYQPTAIERVTAVPPETAPATIIERLKAIFNQNRVKKESASSISVVTESNNNLPQEAPISQTPPTGEKPGKTLNTPSQFKLNLSKLGTNLGPTIANFSSLAQVNIKKFSNSHPDITNSLVGALSGTVLGGIMAIATGTPPLAAIGAMAGGFLPIAGKNKTAYQLVRTVGNVIGGDSSQPRRKGGGDNLLNLASGAGKIAKTASWIGKGPIIFVVGGIVIFLALIFLLMSGGGGLLESTALLPPYDVNLSNNVGIGTSNTGGNCPTLEEISQNRQTTPETCKYFNPNINIFNTSISQSEIDAYVSKYSSIFINAGKGDLDEFKRRINYIISKSQEVGLNPKIFLGYWKTESMFSTYPNASDLGCAPGSTSMQGFETQVRCAVGLLNGSAEVTKCTAPNLPASTRLAACNFIKHQVATKYCPNGVHNGNQCPESEKFYIYDQNLFNFNYSTPNFSFESDGQQPIKTIDAFAEAYGSRSPNLALYEGITTNNNCIHTYNLLIESLIELSACTSQPVGKEPLPTPNPYPNFKLVHYYQHDPRWANLGLPCTVSNTGCGPTTLAMILSSFGDIINPAQMFLEFYNGGYLNCNFGTLSPAATFQSFANKYSYQFVNKSLAYGRYFDIQLAETYIKAGYLIIGSYPTRSGIPHIFMITNTSTALNQITIYDPNLLAPTTENPNNMYGSNPYSWSYAYPIIKTTMYTPGI